MIRKGFYQIGFGNMVVASRLVAILVPGSSPMRRFREETRKSGKLVDATHGRKCRSILVLDSDHVILSSRKPETIFQRFDQGAFDPADLGKEVLPSKE